MTGANWRGVLLDALGSARESAAQRFGAHCVVAGRAGGGKRSGWCARARPHPDPAAVMGREAGVALEFLKRAEFGPRADVGGQYGCAYNDLPDGVYTAAACAGLPDAVWRHWFEIRAGRIWVVTRDADEGRALLGLPPLAEARRAHVARVLDDNRMRRLIGTEKQAAWADTIRARAIDVCPAELLPVIAGREDARWWIDRRASSPRRLLAMCFVCDPHYEALGRVLANVAYAACEPVGEVAEVVTRHVAWPTHSASVDETWSALLSAASAEVAGFAAALAGDGAVRAAYRARWSELLAASSAVIAVSSISEESQLRPTTIIGSAASRPPAVLVPLGTLYYGSDDFGLWIATVRDDVLDWFRCEAIG